MSIDIEKSRYDGFSLGIDDLGILRISPLSFSKDLLDLVVGDDNHGIFNRRPSRAVDQSCAFNHEQPIRLLRANENCASQQQTKNCPDEKVKSSHRKFQSTNLKIFIRE